MLDPTRLVDHVYQMMINDKQERMRNESYYSSFRYGNDLLRSLYSESQIQLSGHPMHNQHINYYNHIKCIDTTVIYFPSKVYEFQDIENHIALGPERREQGAEIPDCALMIYTCDKAVKQGLLSNCRVIMRNQALSDLFMDRVKSTDFPQKFAFNISKHFQSLTLKWCDFPSQTLNHLMEQINKCNTLRKMDLLDTSLEAVSSLTLSNKTSLTHLYLNGTAMSRELSRSVCHQLTNLTQLKHLDLSDNDLSTRGHDSSVKQTKPLILELLQYTNEDKSEQKCDWSTNKHYSSQ